MAKKKPTTSKTTKKKAPARKGRAKAAPDAAGKHLVIVESPTKAKTINKYLGDDYVVMASVGHIRDLPSRNPKGVKNPVPGVDLDNRFEPTYEVMPDSKKTVGELKKAAKKAADVWFATDLDREGEAIAWHCAHALDYPVAEAKRVVFNAITKAEIENAFSHPRPLEINRVDAQQARRILDRIVGYQVSPLLWKKVAGGLSAGRVQSVATRLVVEREREIDAFIPDEYWKITGLFTPEMVEAAGLGDGWRKFINVGEDENDRTIKEQNAWLSDHGCIKAELTEYNGKKFNAAERDTALAAARALGFDLQETKAWEDPKAKGPAKSRVKYLGGVALGSPDYAITAIETKRTKSRPSPPFITSTLQQQASTRLGFNLRRTMRVAQQLYEGIDLKGARGQTGLITYMRTDSTHLSDEALGSVRDFVGKKHGDRYLPDKPNFYKSSNKDAQEAHEAIRPTDVSITPDSIRSILSDEQFRLYDLIWRRFVACQMVPAEWDATAVTIEPTGVKAVFRATGRTLVFDGFLKVMGLPKSDDVILPKLTEKQPLAPIDLDPTQHFTSPPARFTEASLQKKLEEEGIGRPSTYAAIISTIQDRKYVETLTPRDKRLKATDMGMVVTDKLIEAFPIIMDVGYTREMEAHLDEIESENKDWRDTLNEFYVPFKEKLDTAHETMTHAKAVSEPAPHICPKCGSPTEYRFGRNGRFLSCTAFNVPPVEISPEGHPAPANGGKWLLYKGKGKARPKVTVEDASEKILWSKLTKDDKAKFQALSDEMPEPCKYAAPIDAEGNPMEPELTDILCPEDGQPMIRRTGRFGPFLASSNYPEVQYIIKLDPKKGHVVLPKAPPMTTDIVCPTCGADNDGATLYVRDSKRGLWLSCSRFPKCRGRVGFGKLDEDVQADLEKKWAQHLKDNPVPEIVTASGHVIREDEEYHPIIAGQEPVAAIGDDPTTDAA
ncbi:MAG: type I DNA topoisomerase [Planctomycetota bacterium]